MDLLFSCGSSSQDSPYLVLGRSQGALPCGKIRNSCGSSICLCGLCEYAQGHLGPHQGPMRFESQVGKILEKLQYAKTLI